MFVIVIVRLAYKAITTNHFDSEASIRPSILVREMVILVDRCSSERFSTLLTKRQVEFAQSRVLGRFVIGEKIESVR
jgi:hypothetical protein